jgi:YD repeat-containing protein
VRPIGSLSARLSRVSLFALLLLTLYACFICSDAFADDDTCVKDGGTADCIGPDFGVWEHQVSNGSIVGQGLTEAAAIAAYKQNTLDAMLRSGNIPCDFTLTDETAPLPPMGVGAGVAETGNYGDALGGLGTYSRISWYLSTESEATRIPLKAQATYGTQSGPPCMYTYGPTYAYIQRHRAVFCPVPYWQNGSGVSTSYCWRRHDTLDTQKGLCDHCPMAGNPTNPSNGNKYQAETDYVGPDGLTFVRYYNNQLFTGQGWAPERKVFGPNWRSTYERRIRFNNSKLFPTVFAQRPGGNTLHFVFANGEFQPDADVADRLVRLNDGSGNVSGWQYTVAATEERETYDAQGRLLSIATRTGIVWTLGYDTNGRLTSVIDSFGRSLTFGYTGDALTSLTDPDGKVYSYTHNAVGNVTSVTYPDNRTRTYVYAETEHTQGNIRPYALTGIVDESNSRFATYKYDGGEWVTSSEHAGGVEKYSFVYRSNYTIVTDPLLQERYFQFTNMLGLARNTSLLALCTGAGCTSQTETKTFDANANVASRTDPKGNKTCYAYDLSRNLETIRLEGLAPGLIDCQCRSTNLASELPLLAMPPATFSPVPSSI